MNLQKNSMDLLKFLGLNTSNGSAKNKQKLSLKHLWPHQYENVLSMVMSGCVEL